MISIFSLPVAAENVARAPSTMPSNGGLSVQSAMPAVDCVINPYRVADIASPVAGIIEKLYVERSQQVSAGQIIAQLEAKVERANVDLARSRASVVSEIGVGKVNMNFDTRRKERVDSLREQQNISEENADQVDRDARLSEWKLKQAEELAGFRKLELKRAEEQLNQKSIRAPFSGFVLDTYKDRGEHVEEQAIMRLAQLDPLVVEAIVPMENFGLIRAGMLAEIHPDVLVDKKLTGKVTIVDRMGDTASNTFGVKLVLPNPDNQIPAGLKCVVKFLEPTEEIFEPAGTKIVADADADTDTDGKKDQVSKHEESPVAELEQTSPQPIPVIDPVPIPVIAVAEQEKPVPQEKRVSGYVVLADQGKTRMDTLEIIQRMQQVGITDRQEVGHGPFKNMIMLGLYKNHHVAVRRQQALEDIGFKTFIGNRENGLVERDALVAEQADDSYSVEFELPETSISENEVSGLTEEELTATSHDMMEAIEREPNGYVVLADQGETQQETREIISYMRNAGVDDLQEVDHGPFKGTIMLGLYNRRHIAERRKLELEGLGFITYIDGRY